MYVRTCIHTHVHTHHTCAHTHNTTSAITSAIQSARWQVRMCQHEYYCEHDDHAQLPPSLVPWHQRVYGSVVQCKLCVGTAHEPHNTMTTTWYIQHDTTSTHSQPKTCRQTHTCSYMHNSIRITYFQDWDLLNHKHTTYVFTTLEESTEARMNTYIHTYTVYFSRPRSSRWKHIILRTSGCVIVWIISSCL